jgi:hypothetical protein
MTKREKTLAVTVGVLILLVGVFYAAQRIRLVLRSNRQLIVAAENEIRAKQRIVRLSRLEADRMHEYERMSLPGNLEKARSLYQNWLLDLVTEVELEDAQVNVLSSRDEGGVCHLFAFTVSCRGDLPQLVDFLYRFYTADLLHRIRRLYVSRIKGSRQLDLTFSIEALSLPTSSHEDRLNEQPLDQLDYGLLAAYLDTILNRNLSGPANREPSLDYLGERRGYTSQPVSFSVAARDPDQLDRLRYGIDGSDLAGARIDPQTGRFEWTPEKPGDYQVVITATDDGLPPKTVSQTVKISVTDPPPPAPEEPAAPPKPSFELAKFAFLTAITEAGGRRQAWISLRTEGKLLKLFEGDKFNVGEVTVTVTKIDDKAVELDTGVLETRIAVSLGKNLAEGRTLEPADS